MGGSKPTVTVQRTGLSPNPSPRMSQVSHQQGSGDDTPQAARVASPSLVAHRHVGAPTRATAEALSNRIAQLEKLHSFDEKPEPRSVAKPADEIASLRSRIAALEGQGIASQQHASAAAP